MSLVPRIYLRLACLHADLAWPVTDLWVPRSYFSVRRYTVPVELINANCGVTSFLGSKTSRIGKTMWLLIQEVFKCFKKLNCMAYTRHAERSRLELALVTNGSETAAAAALSLLWSLMDRKLRLRWVSNQANPFFAFIYIWRLEDEGFGQVGQSAFSPSYIVWKERAQDMR